MLQYISNTVKISAHGQARLLLRAVDPATTGGLSMGLLPDTQNRGLHMRRECRERFRRQRGLAIPTCITARASRTCRDACRDRYLAVSFEVGGRENVPGIPGVCATRNFSYLVRGPWNNLPRHEPYCSQTSDGNVCIITYVDRYDRYKYLLPYHLRHTCPHHGTDPDNDVFDDVCHRHTWPSKLTNQTNPSKHHPLYKISRIMITLLPSPADYHWPWPYHWLHVLGTWIPWGRIRTVMVNHFSIGECYKMQIHNYLPQIIQCVNILIPSYIQVSSTFLRSESTDIQFSKSRALREKYHKWPHVCLVLLLTLIPTWAGCNVAFLRLCLDALTGLSSVHPAHTCPRPPPSSALTRGCTSRPWRPRAPPAIHYEKEMLDDVTTWTLSALLATYEGNTPITVRFPSHKSNGQ